MVREQLFSEYFRKRNQRRTAVVFEAGPTHDGLNMAKKLVDIAAGAGADAVKFQTLDAVRLVPSRDTMFTYDYLADKTTGRTETVTESLQEILLRRSLTMDEWSTLIRYCRERGVAFFSTASTVEEMRFLHGEGCSCVKIASGDINYHWLLRQAARYDWIVQIDTGSATIAEVEQAVDVLESAGTDRIIINHCPSGYPARLETINLRVLTTLRQMFPYPVAFSDHSPGSEMDIAAVALGADLVEKTITLDRSIRSPEHIMSLEPDEADAFVRTIRNVEAALGSPRRRMTEGERQTYMVARRSIVAGRDIAEGEILAQEAVEYARPGDGLAPDLDWLVLGKAACRRISRGEKILPGDVR